MWCPLRFLHNMMFGSSLSPVVCRRAHVLFMLFVFVCSHIVAVSFIGEGNQRIHRTAASHWPTSSHTIASSTGTASIAQKKNQNCDIRKKCSYIYKCNCQRVSKPIILVHQITSPVWLSPFKVRIPPSRGILDIILCDEVGQWLAAVRWILWFPSPIKLTATIWLQTNTNNINKTWANIMGFDTLWQLHL
jgi:hypothetical protein